MTNLSIKGEILGRRDYTSNESIKSLKIVALRGDQALQDIADKEGLQIVYVSSKSSGLEMIKLGRAELITCLGDECQIYKETGNLKPLPKYERTINLDLVFHKGAKTEPILRRLFPKGTKHNSR